ncbi:hypothetical protein ADUPG1_010381, partial [Aduncisulcus paluster]
MVKEWDSDEKVFQYIAQIIDDKKLRKKVTNNSEIQNDILITLAKLSLFTDLLNPENISLAVRISFHFFSYPGHPSVSKTAIDTLATICMCIASPECSPYFEFERLRIEGIQREYDRLSKGSADKYDSKSVSHLSKRDKESEYLGYEDQCRSDDSDSTTTTSTIRYKQPLPPMRRGFFFGVSGNDQAVLHGSPFPSGPGQLSRSSSQSSSPMLSHDTFTRLSHLTLLIRLLCAVIGSSDSSDSSSSSSAGSFSIHLRILALQLLSHTLSLLSPSLFIRTSNCVRRHVLPAVLMCVCECCSDWEKEERDKRKKEKSLGTLGVDEKQHQEKLIMESAKEKAKRDKKERKKEERRKMKEEKRKQKAELKKERRRSTATSITSTTVNPGSSVVSDALPSSLTTTTTNSSPVVGKTTLTTSSSSDSSVSSKNEERYSTETLNTANLFHACLLSLEAMIRVAGPSYPHTFSRIITHIFLPSLLLIEQINGSSSHMKSIVKGNVPSMGIMNSASKDQRPSLSSSSETRRSSIHSTVPVWSLKGKASSWMYSSDKIREGICGSIDRIFSGKQMPQLFFFKCSAFISAIGALETDQETSSSRSIENKQKPKKTSKKTIAAQQPGTKSIVSSSSVSIIPSSTSTVITTAHPETSTNVSGIKETDSGRGGEVKGADNADKKRLSSICGLTFSKMQDMSPHCENHSSHSIFSNFPKHIRNLESLLFPTTTTSLDSEHDSDGYHSGSAIYRSKVSQSADILSSSSCCSSSASILPHSFSQILTWADEDIWTQTITVLRDILESDIKQTKEIEEVNQKVKEEERLKALTSSQRQQQRGSYAGSSRESIGSVTSPSSHKIHALTHTLISALDGLNIDQEKVKQFLHQASQGSSSSSSSSSITRGVIRRGTIVCDDAKAEDIDKKTKQYRQEKRMFYSTIQTSSNWNDSASDNISLTCSVLSLILSLSMSLLHSSVLSLANLPTAVSSLDTGSTPVKTDKDKEKNEYSLTNQSKHFVAMSIQEFNSASVIQKYLGGDTEISSSELFKPDTVGMCTRFMKRVRAEWMKEEEKAEKKRKKKERKQLKQRREDEKSAKRGDMIMSTMSAMLKSTMYADSDSEGEKKEEGESKGAESLVPEQSRSNSSQDEQPVLKIDKPQSSEDEAEEEEQEEEEQEEEEEEEEEEQEEEDNFLKSPFLEIDQSPFLIMNANLFPPLNLKSDSSTPTFSALFSSLPSLFHYNTILPQDPKLAAALFLRYSAHGIGTGFSKRQLGYFLGGLAPSDPWVSKVLFYFVHLQSHMWKNEALDTALRLFLDTIHIPSDFPAIRDRIVRAFAKCYSAPSGQWLEEEQKEREIEIEIRRRKRKMVGVDLSGASHSHHHTTSSSHSSHSSTLLPELKDSDGDILDDVTSLTSRDSKPFSPTGSNSSSLLSSNTIETLCHSLLNLSTELHTRGAKKVSCDAFIMMVRGMHACVSISTEFLSRLYNGVKKVPLREEEISKRMKGLVGWVGSGAVGSGHSLMLRFIEVSARNERSRLAMQKLKKMSIMSKLNGSNISTNRVQTIKRQIGVSSSMRNIHQSSPSSINSPTSASSSSRSVFSMLSHSQRRKLKNRLKNEKEWKDISLRSENRSRMKHIVLSGGLTQAMRESVRYLLSCSSSSACNTPPAPPLSPSSLSDKFYELIDVLLGPVLMLLELTESKHLLILLGQIVGIWSVFISGRIDGHTKNVEEIWENDTASFDHKSRAAKDRREMGEESLEPPRMIIPHDVLVFPSSLSDKFYELIDVLLGPVLMLLELTESKHLLILLGQIVGIWSVFISGRIDGHTKNVEEIWENDTASFDHKSRAAKDRREMGEESLEPPRMIIPHDVTLEDDMKHIVLSGGLTQAMRESVRYLLSCSSSSACNTPPAPPLSPSSLSDKFYELIDVLLGPVLMLLELTESKHLLILLGQIVGIWSVFISGRIDGHTKNVEEIWENDTASFDHKSRAAKDRREMGEESLEPPRMIIPHDVTLEDDIEHLSPFALSEPGRLSSMLKFDGLAYALFTEKSISMFKLIMELIVRSKMGLIGISDGRDPSISERKLICARERQRFVDNLPTRRSTTSIRGHLSRTSSNATSVRAKNVTAGSPVPQSPHLGKASSLGVDTNDTQGSRRTSQISGVCCSTPFSPIEKILNLGTLRPDALSPSLVALVSPSPSCFSPSTLLPCSEAPSASSSSSPLSIIIKKSYEIGDVFHVLFPCSFISFSERVTCEIAMACVCQYLYLYSANDKKEDGQDKHSGTGHPEERGTGHPEERGIELTESEDHDDSEEDGSCQDHDMLVSPFLGKNTQRMREWVDMKYDRSKHYNDVLKNMVGESIFSLLNASQQEQSDAYIRDRDSINTFRQLNSLLLHQHMNYTPKQLYDSFLRLPVSQYVLFLEALSVYVIEHHAHYEIFALFVRFVILGELVQWKEQRLQECSYIKTIEDRSELFSAAMTGNASLDSDSPFAIDDACCSDDAAFTDDVPTLIAHVCARRVEREEISVRALRLFGATMTVILGSESNTRRENEMAILEQEYDIASAKTTSTPSITHDTPLTGAPRSGSIGQRQES